MRAMEHNNLNALVNYYYIVFGANINMTLHEPVRGCFPCDHEVDSPLVVAVPKHVR